jgi:hypothetical protein
MLKHILLAAAVSVGPMTIAGCSQEPQRTERWATTENTNVEIDWDKVNEAYKQANGPEDFEKRVNEIYEGGEVISVAVQDDGARAQVVTGFFDKDKSGSVDEGEKIFTITREITGEGQAQVQTMGHGAYASYHSPMLSIVSGMMLGSMLSNAFSPHYVPVYTTPYMTSAARVGHLHNERSSYRAANPSRFGGKPSTSGRSYGTPSKSWGGRSGGGRAGGGRFGLAARGAVGPRPRLAA